MDPSRFLQEFQYSKGEIQITDREGKIKFETNESEFPLNWSKTACDILAYNFFRRGVVPPVTKKIYEDGVPSWLQRSEPDWSMIREPNNQFKNETSIKQVVHRMAGTWTYWGWKLGYFNSEKEAFDLYVTATSDLINQKSSPNTPQWLNTGLWWAYGTSRKDTGYYIWDFTSGDIVESPCSFKHPLLSACFILSVKDSLSDPGGIYDLILREARVFKFGAGSGVNFSNLRSKDELLHTGHKSSGIVKFLELSDFSAGCIKSGGIDRGSSKMAVLDIQHPDVESFCAWKAECEVINKLLFNSFSLAFKNLKPDYAPNDYSAPRSLGSNTNTSVRITDDFMERVINDQDWSLVNSAGQVVKNVSARKLWNDICYYAWLCGDPGIQFADTINKWNTCKNSGRIEASNPCAEYFFLNNTACNLASLNLIKFISQDGFFDLEGFIKSIKVWTTILDICISFAEYPSYEVCHNSILFRTIGLGFTNLGSFLMNLALPYDSDEGRDIAALLTACLTATALLNSSELAKKLGFFPEYPKNQEVFKDIVEQYRIEFNKLSKTVSKSNALINISDIIECTKKCFNDISSECFRNAHVTCIAPTGTISLLMDAETTGIEPEFNLVKIKRLSNGAHINFVNKSFLVALKKLGYTDDEIQEVEKFVAGHKTLVGAPSINHSSLKELGFSEETLDLIEHLILYNNSLRDVFQLKNFSKETITEELKISSDIRFDESTFLLELLNFSNDEIKKAEQFCFGSKTVINAPNIKPEHFKIFQVANGASELDTISPEGHVKMVAACQKFLSGGISKTVNLPSSASIDDVDRIFSMAHKLGCKSITVYRNGSKNFQPLIVKDSEPTPTYSKRRPLPSRRSGFTQKVSIAGQKIYLRTGEYEDGKLGEIFIDLSKEGAALRSIMNHFAIAVSIGLQYGVPLEEFVDAFIFTKYEPSGPVVGSSAIKTATSISDYIFRELAVHYLKRYELAQNKHLINKNIITEEKNVKYFEGDPCPECGNFTLLRSGSCIKCVTCGYSTGCS